MKFRYILTSIFSIIIMSLFAISASADSWIDFGQNYWYNSTETDTVYTEITRQNANRAFYGTPTGKPYPANVNGYFPENSVKGVIISYLPNATADTSIYKVFYCTSVEAGGTISARYRNNIATIYASNYQFGWTTAPFYTETKKFVGRFSGNSYYPQSSSQTYGIDITKILYSDYNISYNNEIIYKSTSSGAYFDTLETVASVNSSGIGGYIKRYGSPDFDNTQIYFRTAVVDSLVNPPLGYQFGKSLAQQNVNATNLYEPNYNDVYPDYISPLRTFPLLSNEFSSLYNITPINLSVLSAYMQGILQYDKSYTCLIMVSTAWLVPFDDWIIIGSQSFNYSAGTIIDLGQNISPPADDNNGGVDLGATPPQHDWNVNGSDVVVPEIDFSSPEYKNPFDVSFLFFYPENGENKPTFYLQYCLIAIAICAVAYLLFGKS